MKKSTSYDLLIFDWEGTLAHGSAPIPGALSVLTKLQALGYTMAIATGRGRRGLENDLHRFEMKDFFTLWRCGDDGFGKPHPEMLHYLLEHLDESPGRSLMIGDTPMDIHMAQAAHMDSLGVSYGLTSREDLLSLNPTDCIDDIIQLPSWLENH